MIKSPRKLALLVLGVLILIVFAVAVPLPRYQPLAACKPGGDCPNEGWYWGDSIWQRFRRQPTVSPTVNPAPVPNVPPEPPSSQTSSFEAVGTLQRVDCTTAGVGCYEFMLRVGSQEAYALSGVDQPDRYFGRRVRIKGEWREAGPAGWIQVKSIELVD